MVIFRSGQAWRHVIAPGRGVLYMRPVALARWPPDHSSRSGQPDGPVGGKEKPALGGS